MRRAKKHLLSLAAALIAVAGVWAMHATKHSSQKFDTYYYHYLGNDDQLSSYRTQSNWEAVQSPTEPGCEGNQLPCVVESTASSIPAFTSSITQSSDVTDNTVALKNVEAQ